MEQNYRGRKKEEQWGEGKQWSGGGGVEDTTVVWEYYWGWNILLLLHFIKPILCMEDRESCYGRCILSVLWQKKSLLVHTGYTFLWVQGQTEKLTANSGWRIFNRRPKYIPFGERVTILSLSHENVIVWEHILCNHWTNLCCCYEKIRKGRHLAFWVNHHERIWMNEVK